MPAPTAEDFRTMFMFGSPNDAPRSWDLTFEAFTAALQRRDPTAYAQLRDSARRGPVLDIAFTTSTGEECEGMVSVAPDGAALEEATAAEAAEFAAWLRAELVPPGVPIDFNIRPAAELLLPNRRLPDTQDPVQLREALLGYVRDVLAARDRGEM